MIADERQIRLAKNLVNYSVKVGKGDKVWLDVIGDCGNLAEIVIKEIYAAGGVPFVNVVDRRLLRATLLNCDEQQLKIMSERDCALMDKMDCYIGIRGGNNSYELSDVPEEKLRAYETIYSTPVHSDRRVAKTRWVILRYPTEGISQLAGMSTEAFED